MGRRIFALTLRSSGGGNARVLSCGVEDPKRGNIPSSRGDSLEQCALQATSARLYRQRGRGRRPSPSTSPPWCARRGSDNGTSSRPRGLPARRRRRVAAPVESPLSTICGAVRSSIPPGAACLSSAICRRRRRIEQELRFGQGSPEVRSGPRVPIGSRGCGKPVETASVGARRISLRCRSGARGTPGLLIEPGQSGRGQGSQ